MKKIEFRLALRLSAAWVISLGLVWAFVQLARAQVPASPVQAGQPAQLPIHDPTQASESPLKIIAEDAHGLTFEFRLPEWKIASSGDSGTPCKKIQLTGFDGAATPG